jgi:ubiquinol-cytochrome c reductase iron-sulfur subunit
VALYRAADRELICPCHQSAFDVMADGAVISGPADHALPRLPIEIGSDGFLRATGDFPEPVGPGFWERG